MSHTAFFCLFVTQVSLMPFVQNFQDLPWSLFAFFDRWVRSGGGGGGAGFFFLLLMTHFLVSKKVLKGNQLKKNSVTKVSCFCLRVLI